MTASEKSMRSTLPLMMEKKLSSPCTSVESELARATNWPVGIRSRLSKSSTWRCSCMALRRSNWTPSAMRPPR